MKALTREEIPPPPKKIELNIDHVLPTEEQGLSHHLKIELLYSMNLY